MASSNQQFNKGQRFFAALDPTGRLNQTVARSDRDFAVLQQQEEQAAQASEARKNQAKFKILESLMEGHTSGTAPLPEDVFAQVSQGLQEASGLNVDFGAVQAGTPKTSNRFMQLLNEKDRIERQLDNATDAREVARLGARQKAIQGRIDKSDEGKKLALKEVTSGQNTLMLDPITGETVRSIPNPKQVASVKPSNTFVNFKLPDGTTKTLRSSDPEIDNLLANGAVRTGTGSGGGVSIRSPDGTVVQFGGGQDATIGTQGQFERKVALLDDTILRSMDLAKKLRPEDLGFQGVMGEFFIDKIMGQFAPEMADPTRIENRTLLKSLREASLRQISTDNRFNAQDRAAIEAILPEDGVFESLPDARAKLEMLQVILTDRARILGGVINRKPITAMSPDEIRSAFSAGQIDEVTAIRTLKLLHGNLSGGN